MKFGSPFALIKIIVFYVTDLDKFGTFYSTCVLLFALMKLVTFALTNCDVQYRDISCVSELSCSDCLL
jgi:hypothetical protein